MSATSFDSVFFSVMLFATVLALLYVVFLCIRSRIAPSVLFNVAFSSIEQGVHTVRGCCWLHMTPLFLCAVFNLPLSASFLMASFVFNLGLFYIALYNPRGLRDRVAARAVVSTGGLYHYLKA